MKFTMPPELVDNLNESVDFIAKNDLAQTLDHSEHLAGKVSQELVIPHETLGENVSFFFNAAKAFVENQHRWFKSEQCDHHVNQFYDEETQSLQLQMTSAWFVRSFAGDYNPVHLHPGIQLASFGFLKLPDWDDEVSVDGADHFGRTHGCTQFLYGAGPAESMIRSSYTVKPKVGDFYVFPAWLNHCVYPFRTPGERRSLAINYMVHKAQKLSSPDNWKPKNNPA